MRKFKLSITFVVAGIVLLVLAAWANNQFPIRAVYLVQGQGQLDKSELDRHPEARLWPFENGALVDQARAGWCCAEMR
jgi:hypothetical protein